MPTVDFLHILFDADEQTCFSQTPFGTQLKGINYFELEEQFFSINPMHTSRRDDNVTCYRNILLEIDNMPLTAQKVILERVPYTTLVFSGSKSYHATISLATPAKDRAEYDALVRRIYAKVPEADKANKNPSRFSRLGGATRDNGRVQEILDIRQRIERAELEAWLGPAPEKEESPELPESNKRRILRGSTMYFLLFGAPEGEWNRNLFLSALDMARSGYEEDEIFSKLETVTGHLDASDKRTIRSAITSSANNL